MIVVYFTLVINTIAASSIHAVSFSFLEELPPPTFLVILMMLMLPVQIATTYSAAETDKYYSIYMYLPEL